MAVKYSDLLHFFHFLASATFAVGYTLASMLHL